VVEGLGQAVYENAGFRPPNLDEQNPLGSYAILEVAPSVPDFELLGLH
jgi:hypothetical protein